MDSKKFLDQEGVKFLWSKISMEDYPNNETLIAVLNAIDTTKQDKNLIVTKGADGLSTHSPTEILEAVNNGINVYYTPNISAGTLHPYLEGSNQVSYFHSNYIDNSKAIATGFLINTNKNITVSNYSALNNYYTKTETDNQIANLVNSAPETLDTLGELATAFQENKEVVDALNSAITNKADTSIVPTNLINGSSEGSLRGINTLTESDSYVMGVNAFAIGSRTKASGKNSFASGQDVEATGSYAHAEGYGTFATAAAAHAEGYDTHATARYAHAEGASTTASGNNSHAEGNSTTSSGHYSHAEGNFTTAAGAYSHAEGNYTQTEEDGTFAHAEGSYTKATKTGAHAEGNYTEANGTFSHTEGYYTKANSMYQHVRGKYNIVDDNSEYSTIIGNGDADSNRKNIHTLDWDGNAWFAGDVYIGSIEGFNKDEGSQKLATEEYVNNQAENSVKKYFLIIETIREGANYLLDGITFNEIHEKFNTGNVNMVCHIDGTDYIPLLSVTSSSIVFSGICNTTSISLVFNTQGVGTLTSTYLSRSSDLNNYYTKTEADNQIAALVNSAPETLDTLGELATAFNENKEVVDALNEAITNKANKNYETWTFTLTDGTTVEKQVLINA